MLLLAFRTARAKMKPESVLESDPTNICLPMKPKIVPDEVPKGRYGLVINGYSLVGITELQLYCLSPKTLFLCPIQLREISGTSPTQESPCSPSSCPCLKDTFPQATLSRNKRRNQRKILSLSKFLTTDIACHRREGKGKHNQSLR